MQGSDDCMDTNIRMEFSRVWEQVSSVKQDLAVLKFKVDTTNKELISLHEELDNHLEKKWDDLNHKKDRKNNIKIALIAVLAAGIPSLIAILSR